MEASEKFLHDYLNSCAPPGREDSCRDLWIKYVERFSDRIVRDCYGSVAAIQGEGATVVLEAHSDEIAWLVNFISPDGYVYVVKSGGSDAVIAPSKKVTIYSRKGPLPGVFAWPSAQNRAKADETPKTSNLFIDVGCSSKEEVLELGIDVGDPILFDEDVTLLNNRLYAGKALDNRVGGFIVAEVARKISDARSPLPFSLCAVNAVQEEVGLRGAEMMADRLRPKVAIVVDVTNDTNTPRMDKQEKGDIGVGLGPALVTAPSVHPLLLKRLVATARTHGIPFQRAAMSRSTGTDADAFAYAGEGIPTALLCVPIKYMHTTVEAAHKEDIAASVELLYHFIRFLDLEELEADGLFGASYTARSDALRRAAATADRK
ncbi:MAG TPA: M20/M25/M40 family metallo-hydrolase [Chthoniobacterales bacterium]